ncbi:LOW QUALITY PROTEIN: gamma-tubulin complex component 6 [Rhagoletis pomonella]|uniref:LOW QUALITY PROTEIN: gamma-tubulin complex component 6 n=1 Tax=Rhagoletis pomonella TaxID=28610 RepID=UPI001786FE32|nr:LOW QUALITY PROTEIN: gamma-tubulin complex component 6 [Rhagoletis pomonella]
MHDSDLVENADSVNYLITELCRSLASQHGLEEPECSTAVRKLKPLAFEILLKKSTQPHSYPPADDESEFDPQRAVDMHIFAAKLHSRADSQVCARYEALEQQMADISHVPYFTDGPGRGVLQLLLLLQGNVREEEQVPVPSPPALLVPGPFTLFASYENNRYYPKPQICDWLHPQPRFFKGVQDVKALNNPYMPKYLLGEECNLLAKIEQKYGARVDRRPATAQDCTFTAMTRRLLGASVRVNMNAFRLLTDCEPQSAEKLNFKFKMPFPREPVPVIEKTASIKEEPRILSWNWQSLGCRGVLRQRPFASEAEVMIDLKCHLWQVHGRKFEVSLMSCVDFMHDLKALTAGIQSETFQHDEQMVFTMRPNITVEGLLPETVRSYAESFLDCGTCYKRLNTMIQKKDYKFMFEGFIFRALCSAIDEYLLTFRQYVFAHHDDTLIAYYARMRKIMRQISNLSFTLAIHTDVDSHVTLPMGSQFLGYLYREIVHTTEKDYIMLLVYILKSCCHVYFKHLQKWIYYGLLDDPSNELFICFVDHYRPNTKYFYDKAYFVRKESVPGFFQGYEDDILQCGKYTMLLKAYKPNHPLFTLDYPLISVCLTYDEIQRLKRKCVKYRERAQAACGIAEVSIRRIFEARSAMKREFYQRACKRTRENLEKWSLEQHDRALLAAEQKRRRHHELTTQLQDAKQRKIDERRANVELELRLLRETEKIEEQRLLRENINLRKRIEYYQELSDMMRKDESEKVAPNQPSEPQAKQEQPPKLSPQSDGSADSAHAPQTPCSGGSGGTETDFESCCDEEGKVGDAQVDADADADSASLYAECLSEEFEQKFVENENELKTICAKLVCSDSPLETDKTLVLLEEPAAGATQEVSSDASLDSALGFTQSDTTGLLVDASKTTFLKRSASDVINSNELPMGGNARQTIRGTTVTICPAPTALAPPANERPITEAQRNKIRVLAHEFGTYCSTTPQQPIQPDINLNTLPDSELTDLQRNRRRMMQNDLFAEYNKSPLADRAHLNLNLDTERARNRRRVLESEFDILTGKTPSEQAATPMSTTSDTPLTESTSELTAAIAQQSDRANGNTPTKMPLKINVQLANEQQPKAVEGVSSGAGLLGCQTADAHDPSATPESALNTAGLQAKHGFDFVDAEREKKQQQAIAMEAPIQPDAMSVSSGAESEEELAIPVQDDSDPYKRSRELLDSNFTCATRSPYMRLNMSTTPMVVAGRKSRESLQQLKVNSMSVITLTEFLQKSVILPMTTHLGLVNNEVMRLFLEELRILDHLRSLRHYFFLMDGEFGSIICDGIIGKLESGATPAKLLNYQMLHSILDTALVSSITGNDKNAENLSFTISDVPQKFDLTNPGVLNVLSLSYRIEWPLNLILSPETLEQYGNIFKYLIKVRRISWVLERAYQLLKEAVKKHGKQILKSPQYRHVQLMRHKFYHFVHALQNHITANALQASWKTFKDDLLQAKSIEDIYRKHTTYVKRILFLCMLNRHSAEFYNTIESIFKISLKFYNNLKSREFKQRSGDEHFTHSRYEKLANDEQEFDKFIKFTIYLGNKIVRHGYQEEIGQLIALINFNQYYSASTIA